MTNVKDPPSKEFKKFMARKVPSLPPPKLLLIGLAGVLTLTGGVWAVQLLKKPIAEEIAPSGQPIAVQTLVLQPRAIAQTLTLSGTIQPIQKATLSTRVSGRIVYLPVEAGDRVHKGQVLARINVLDIAAQTNQAQAGVAQAQANLAQAQAGVAQAQAALNQQLAQRLDAQSALKLARIEQKRMAQLQAEGVVSQQQLDRANTSLEQAQAKLAQVQANIRQAQAAINQAQAAIAQSQAAVRQAEAGVTAASINQSYGTILAPFDGTVTAKLAYEGETTNPYSMNGTELLKLENSNRLQLEVTVPEANRQYVRLGQTVQVQIGTEQQSSEGKIAQIISAADPNSRSFMVKIPLRPSLEIMSGMFGRIELPTGEKAQAIAIPRSAIFRRGQLEGVYVTGSNNRAEIRWVKTGKARNDQVEIVSGLSKGDRLITNHLNQLTDGQLIKTQS